MIERIERYDGFRLGICVYGTKSASTSDIEGLIIPAFIQASITENRNGGTISGENGEILGTAVTSPFHLYRKEPCWVGRLFGARSRVTLEKGMTVRENARTILDDVVQNLAYQHPKMKVQ